MRRKKTVIPLSILNSAAILPSTLLWDIRSNGKWKGENGYWASMHPAIFNFHLSIFNF